MDIAAKDSSFKHNIPMHMLRALCSIRPTIIYYISNCKKKHLHGFNKCCLVVSDDFLQSPPVVLPVPVPVFVPVPLNMYSQYTPIPMALPLPVSWFCLGPVVCCAKFTLGVSSFI
jgi:hypothetical protein